MWTQVRAARLVLLAVAAVTFSGCGAGSVIPDGSTREPSPSASASAGAASSSAGASGEPAGKFILGLGDSVPGAGGACQSDPTCRSYVVVLAELATAALGQPVQAVNRASNDGVTSASLRRDLQSNPTIREQAAKATMVVVQVGNNDWQGQCTFQNAATCLEKGRRSVAANLNTILDDLLALRGGSGDGIRVVTYANTLAEDSPAESWGYTDTRANEQTMTTIYTRAIRSLDASICAAAKKHNVTCVDLLTAINGKDGSQPSQLGGIHPTRAGHERIADIVAAAGFDDVH